jgi:GT2 family glycosyltransferase
MVVSTAKAFIKKGRDALKKPKNITIVVPVYGDWPSLKACIVALQRHAPKNQEVLFVNDCGPEADVIEKQLLKLITNNPTYRYTRNEHNLGFVKTCNRAVDEIDRTNNDILLLNSDAEITEGAVEEMKQVLSRANNIASVSPRSNNATIFSLPFNPHTLKLLPPQESHEVYMKVKDKLPEVYETPTTHGFCMLIRRSVIKKYGLFDEVFGIGYGEENDFCMRVRNHGYTHAIANKAYVYHEGSKSFSVEQRNERADKNAKIIDERYPSYRADVGEYTRLYVLSELKLVRSLGLFL